MTSSPLPSPAPLARLALIGVGLIGGSFALDLRQRGLVKHVVGVGRSVENLRLAYSRGVIDEYTDDPAQAVVDADLVLLAAPPSQFDSLLARIAPRLAAGTLVSDVGSTKRTIAALYRHHLPHHLAHCVPAHPVAGSTQTGAGAAREGLFAGHAVVLAPLAETAAAAQERIAALWEACGAQIHLLDPARHDTLLAMVSHFPHLLAFDYLNQLLAHSDAATCLALAGTGFRDFTRIAASDPDLWCDITLDNRAVLLDCLADYQQRLVELAALLRAGNRAALHARFTAASIARTNWPSAANTPAGDLPNPDGPQR